MSAALFASAFRKPNRIFKSAFSPHFQTGANTVTVEQRFREIDLSLALRQYERVLMEAFEARLQLDLLDTEMEMTKTERDQKAALLEKRFNILQMRAETLRRRAQELETRISVTTAK